MRWKPNSTVATMLENEGKLLFVEEIDSGKVVFNQPAGHLDKSEALIDGAIRETYEETGYHCEITAYQGLYTYTHPDNDTTYHRHCFVGRIIKHNPEQPLDDGIIATRWLTLQELIDSNKARSPLVIKCAQDYFNNKQYPLDLIYEHKNV